MGFCQILLSVIALGTLANGASSTVPSFNGLLRYDLFSADHDSAMTRSADPTVIMSQLKSLLNDRSVLAKVYQRYLTEFKKGSRQSESQFIKNLLSIAEHNLAYDAGDKTWEKGVNQFTDMTSEELRAYTGAFNLPSTNVTKLDPAVELELSQVQAPQSLDWRQQGIVTPIKNQGQCGSCWAFSSVSVLESKILSINGRATILSEQEMVDCDKNNRACQYGWIEKAFEYLRTRGVMASESYPYNAREGSCRRGNNQPAAWIGSYTQVIGEDRIKEALAQYGMVSVGLGTSDEWSQYRGGIYQGSCGTGGHFVSVVGYGNENGRDYWILKNSWDTWWGEQGYMKLIRGQDKCGIGSRNGGWFISK